MMKISYISTTIIFLRSISVTSAFTTTFQDYRRTSSSSILYESKHEICVLGGGFGGLNTALTLSSLPFPEEKKPTITLVDNKERFVFLPLLYELCVGDASLDEVAPTFESLLDGTGIKFEQASVAGIDADQQNVYLENKEKLKYDSLVVATGASVNLEFIQGAEKYALPFYTLDDCLELKKRLTFLDALIATSTSKEELNVVIVGGGYSGVELALNMKERLGSYENLNVTIVHRGNEILEYATDFNRNTGVRRLEDNGVKTLTGVSVVEVLELEGESQNDFSELKGRCKIVVENGSSKEQDILNADLLLWTAGSMSTNVQKGILNSKLPRDASGRLVTDSYLKVKDYDNIFALGDCARVKKVPYGATAAVAMQQAPCAAWNVYSQVMLNDEDIKEGEKENLQPIPFSYLNLGEMMTLGGDDATISSMGVVEVNGIAASVLRRIIYAVRMPTLQQGLTAAISSSSKRFESVLSSSSKKSGGKSKKIISWK